MPPATGSIMSARSAANFNTSLTSPLFNPLCSLAEKSFKPFHSGGKCDAVTMHAPHASESSLSKLSSMAGVVAGPASKADAPRQNASPISSDDARGSLPTKMGVCSSPSHARNPRPTKYALSGSNAFSASGDVMPRTSSPLVFASVLKACAGGARAFVAWSSSAADKMRIMVQRRVGSVQRVCKADCSLGVGVCKIELSSPMQSSWMREASAARTTSTRWCMQTELPSPMLSNFWILQPSAA